MEKDLSIIINSDEFKKRFREQVIKDTWDKGYPMVYMDEKGYLIREYKDGKIEILQKLK